MPPGFASAQRIASGYSLKLLEENPKPISIIRLGSSLRKQDFTEYSDIDFLAIYQNHVRRGVRTDFHDGLEINVIRMGKKNFIRSAREGSPLELIALVYGKAVHGKAFFHQMEKIQFRPTQRTIDVWLRTASFNMMSASSSYPFPACLCCYFKDLHHGARGFIRAMALKETWRLLEGDEPVIAYLDSRHPSLSGKFRLIIEGRENCMKFRRGYANVKRIRSSGLGKYLLAAEDISIKSMEIIAGLKVPKVNTLIAQLGKKFRIENISSFYLEPESKSLALHLSLRNGRFGFFTLDLKSGKLKSKISKL